MYMMRQDSFRLQSDTDSYLTIYNLPLKAFITPSVVVEGGVTGSLTRTVVVVGANVDRIEGGIVTFPRIPQTERRRP